MKRISIIAVTNIEHGVPKYTAELINELGKCSETVAVISRKNSNASRELSKYANYVVVSSGTLFTELYRTGAEYVLNLSAEEKTEQILFVLDNFFGPFNGVESVIETAEEKIPYADMWSLSESADKDKDLCLFAINEKVILFPGFRDFCEKKWKTDSGSDFLNCLKDFLSLNNFSSDCIFKLNQDKNTVIYDAYSLVSAGFPVLFLDSVTCFFRSVLALKKASGLKSVLEYISHNTEYDVGLILQYAIEASDPFEFLSLMGNHFIVAEEKEIKHRSDAVLVFHAHYDDLIDENISRLNEIAQVCDVIITTTSKEKQQLISRKIEKAQYLSEYGARVILSQGNGRDMAGLLVEARPYISGYKYIGFTHDKKSSHHQRLSGESFKEIITENIICSAGYAESVISLLEKNEYLGLLVPPPPEHSKYFAVTGRRWCENFSCFVKLCGKLGIEVPAQPQWSSFALGTAFWCRYDALRDLFEYDWQHCDFPAEPMPPNGTLSHAIERCFPYIAKKNLYATGIVYTQKTASEYLNMQEYMLTDIVTLLNSRISSESHDLVSYEEKLSKKLKPIKTVRKTAHSSGGYRKHSVIRGIKRRLGVLINKERIKNNSGAKILVILHLFYMESWKEIKEYLKNLEPYNFDLIVTYTAEKEDRGVLADILSYKPEAILKKCRNLGYDVGAFTEVLSEIDTDSYDIIFKLQSKGVKRPKIYIYGNYFKRRDWFLNLFEGCIGAFSVHKTVDKLINDKSAGLVAAENLIVSDPAHKQNMVKAFMREKSINIPDKYLFVAGSCFAVRSCLMKPIGDMKLKVEDYKPAGAEFSLSHIMERLICLTVLDSGYNLCGNKALTLRRTLKKFSADYLVRKKYTGLRLLDDKRFTLDDEFVYFSIEHRLIKKYELVNVPLGKIQREWLGKTIPLKECYPYRYLVTGDKNLYDEYGRLNKMNYGLDIMSLERFERLADSLDRNGFENEYVVVVNKDNVLLDGQHRCCYMLYKYGEDYEVPCLRIQEISLVGQSFKNYLKRNLSEKSLEKLKRIYRKWF
ncbi:MAG: rhamnan synthesis F family protein [Ruminiclostridium sp.]